MYVRVHVGRVTCTRLTPTTAQEVAAATFGAARTWFLVNGTSVGIHATMMASCCPGDAVVLSRNSHVSAVSACILAGAVPFFADTPLDAALGVAHAVTPGALAAALDTAAAACAAAPACVAGPGAVKRQPRVALALVVSPTYFGAAADVAALAQVAHSRGVALAVDEAHGAHWVFDPRLPTPSLHCGADVVIQSTHKTLPALTQASMLHAGQGCRIDTTRLGAALAVLQTTSPSYLLLASLDAVRLGAQHPDSGVRAATDASLALRASLGDHAPGLLVLGSSPAAGVHAWDVSRLTVASVSLGFASGYEAGDALAREGITPELTAPRCVVFALGGGNAATGDMERLRRVLLDMHASAGVDAPTITGQHQHMPEFPSSPVRLAVSPRRAFFAPRRAVPLHQAVDRVSAEWLCPYPPVRVGMRVRQKCTALMPRCRPHAGHPGRVPGLHPDGGSPALPERHPRSGRDGDWGDRHDLRHPGSPGRRRTLRRAPVPRGGMTCTHTHHSCHSAPMTSAGGKSGRTRTTVAIIMSSSASHARMSR